MRCPRDWTTVELWHRTTVKDYSYGNKAGIESLGETCALISAGGSWVRALGETVWNAPGVEFHQQVFVMIRELPAAAVGVDLDEMFVVVLEPKNHPYYLTPLKLIGMRVASVTPTDRDFHYSFFAKWSSDVTREVKALGLALEEKP